MSVAGGVNANLQRQSFGLTTCFINENRDSAEFAGPFKKGL